jgi:TonB family protein
MSRRPWIIGVSLVAHIGAGIGLFASGIWKLDRLDGGKGPGLVVGVLNLHALEGSPPPAPQQKPKVVPFKKVVHDITQPPEERPRDAPPAESTGRPGNGSNPDANGLTGDGVGDEPCLENCAPIASIQLPGDVPAPPPPPKQSRTVAPDILAMHRISGDTQIEPDPKTKELMAEHHDLRVVGTIFLCVSETGEVTSSKVLASTKYDAYDATLAAGVRRWRYRPLMVGGEPYAACGPVTFIYLLTTR